METLKQWELPNGAQVRLEDGELVTFRKMDGMYAQWIKSDGSMAIGNYAGFQKDGLVYKPV